MTSNRAVSPQSISRTEPVQLVRWFPATISAVPGALTGPLERISEVSVGNDDPAVVVKVVDGVQTFMIRNFKGCPLDAYVVANQNSCADALVQWIEAGIGDQYPLNLRADAERGLVAKIHRQRIKSNPEVAVAMSRYLESKTDLENMYFQWAELGLTAVEIQEYEIESQEARFVQSTYERAGDELHNLFRKESWGHYQDIVDTLNDAKTIQTLPGILAASQARLYAMLCQLDCMCPGVYLHQPRAVERVLEATFSSEIVCVDDVDEILKTHLTDDELVATGIRGAAADLSKAITGTWAQAV